MKYTSEKIKSIMDKIGSTDFSLSEETRKRLNNLTKPLNSLGRLEEIAKQVVSITGKKNPSMEKKVIFTLAGDHGVTEEGVSAYPKEVTAQMVYNFVRGGAGINVLARQGNIRIVVADIGVTEKIGPVKPCDSKTHQSACLKIKKVSAGTKNFTRGPAMTMDEAVASIEAGIDLVEEELREGTVDLIGTGEMGIGNTTPASAITAVITGNPVESVTGRGTGIDHSTFKRKVEIIEKAIEINRPDPSDGLDVLSKIGGLEIGGLVGVILASASCKIPVVIDGFISGAAALIAAKIKPEVKDYLIAGHCSYEPGHRVQLIWLGKSPLLDLDMRLGEGTGAALAMHIVDASIRILTEMATFESAGVSKSE